MMTEIILMKNSIMGLHLLSFSIMKVESCMPYLLTCQHVLRAHMPMCLACSCANMSCVSTCSCDHVLTCQHALHALRAYVFTYYNYKWQRWVFNNVFPLHFFYCSLSFSCEIKTVVHSCISLTSQKPLTGVMTNFLKWNGLIFGWA